MPRPVLRSLGSAAAAVALLLPVPASAAPRPGQAPIPGTSCDVLPSNNIWNADISALPVNTKSVAWLASMNAGSTNLHPDFGAPPYGMPYAVVDNSHATTSIKFFYKGQSDPGPYPL